MALETLKYLTEIGGFEIKEHLTPDLLDKKYIVIDQVSNSIEFKIQKGPIKEVSVNGCQVDTMIEAAMLIVDGLNRQFPCDENDYVIGHLTNALGWLKQRKINREARKVEGTSQE